jgi:transposase
VATMTKRSADGLGEFLDVVPDGIAEAEVAGFDETGLRVAGRLHCASTGSYTLNTCHVKRDREGINAAGVLVEIQRLVVEAIAVGAERVDADALDKQIQLYRSAVQPV